jgi:hypothetical protein
MAKIIRFALALAVLAVALLPMSAQARGGADVVKTGSCSARSDWKLKLSKDDGRIETEFEVDQNRIGRKWRVTLKHNGNRFFRGVRTTHAPGGSFEVRRFANDAAGTDEIVAKARNLRSGELCRAVARI